MRTPLCVFATIIAVILASSGSARAQAAENDCIAAPDTECILTLAHQAEEEIEQPVERVRALTRIAVAESMSGYPQQSEASFALAGQIVEDPGLADTLKAVMPDLPEGMELPEGMDIEMLMRQSTENTRRMLYDGMVTAQVEAGMPAENVARFILGLDVPQYRPQLEFSAAAAYVGADRKEDARYFLNSLIAGMNSESAEQPGPGMPGQMMVVSLQARLGDFDDAIATLSDPSLEIDSMSRVGMLSDISRQQRYAEDREGALATLVIAEEYLGEVEAGEIRDMMLDMMSRQRAELTGDKTDESGAAVQTKSGGGCPADFSPMGLAIADAEFGFFDAAVERTLEITDPGRRDNALSRIAGIQAGKDDPEGAHTTALMIGDAGRRSYAFQGIATAQAEAGNAAGVQNAAREINEERMRDFVLTQSIEPLVMAENAAGAASIARDLAMPAMRATGYAAVALAMVRKAAAEEEAAMETQDEAEAGQPAIQ